MRETRDLVAAWKSQPAGAPLVLATVIGNRGSTYRRAGARMLMGRDGWLAGTISGGCLEADLIQTGWERTEEGPVLATYDSTTTEDLMWGFGLGCAGIIEVLVERLGPDGGPIPFLEERICSETPGLIATVITEGESLGRRAYSPEIGQGASGLDTRLKQLTSSTIPARPWVEEVEIAPGSLARVLFEPIRPPLRLGVFGGGIDSMPLLTLAKELGWTTNLFDNKESSSPNLRANRLLVQPWGSSIEMQLDAAVIKTHNYLNDKAVLTSLLQSHTPYIGLLGPRARTDRLMAELRSETPGVEFKAVHGPVGLDIGAEGPHEIALAIVAEIVAEASRRR